MHSRKVREVMLCPIGEHLKQELLKAVRNREHHRVMDLERQERRHKDQCVICTVPLNVTPVITKRPLADQLFGRKVKVIGEEE